MSSDLLNEMRAIRRRAELLNRTLVDDYRPFLSPANGATFFRLPTKIPIDPLDANCTATCTALMSLSLGGGLDQIYGKNRARQRAKEAIRYVFADNWTTANLKQNNAFTAALALRASGILAGCQSVDAEFLDLLYRWREDPVELSPTDEWRKLYNKSVKEVCVILLRAAPQSFSVQDYPPTPAIAYWTLDAAALMGAEIEHDACKRITDWALVEFGRQVSLVSSNHHTMMDPIALAMIASLVRLLRRLARNQACVGEVLAASYLPTDYELVAAIRMFFERQNDAGVWEKYFPLFHYPAAGPNHCWHFEVLEAVFNEFPEIMSDIGILRCINKSLDWLERNRLQFLRSGTLFSGWNSGGDFKALRSGEPESWPTGVAHMCLARLRSRISERISSGVLEKYRDRAQVFLRKDDSAWKKLLDCNLRGVDESRNTAKKLLEHEIVGPAADAAKAQGIAPPASAADWPALLLPSFSMTCRRSALIFGPPGTSKTSVAQAIAERLGWPFIELSPSDFLQRGLDGIYDRVREVFEDLMDLYGAVVLFDEMDALVQSRDRDLSDRGTSTASQGGQLDVTQKFLTTSMLPKLLKLRKQAKVIFFMATNHQRQFDAAIKRTGRFDLLICLGPPSLEEKLGRLETWGKGESASDFEQITATIRAWVDADQESKKLLRRFTYGEMESFLDSLRRSLGGSLKDVAELTENVFHARVREWAKDQIVLCEGSGALDEFKEDRKSTRIQ